MEIKNPRQLLVLVLLATIVSCTDSIDKDREKIVQAQNELTHQNCQNAITILNTIDDRKSSSRWYQTMASAQSCLSPFSEISFFSNNIDKINVTPISNLGKSVASFDISGDMKSTDDLNYTSLRDAVMILSHAGGPVSPNYESRNKIWSEEDNNNMSLQAIYLTLAALGMYMNYYGNGGKTDGGKGGGSASNTCYLDYTVDLSTHPVVYAALHLSTTPCTAEGEGHSDLPSGAATTLTRACEGISLVNTLFDSLRALPSVPQDSGELRSIDDELELIINTCKTTLEAIPIDSKICSSTSIKECEAIGRDHPERIEQYFALVFENIHGG